MRPDSWIALALAVLAVGYAALGATRTLDLRDEGYLLWRAAQVAGGAVPHRDFADVYGPAVLPATALALAVGDGQILAVRMLLALLKGVAVAATFVLARRFLARWLAIAVAGIAIAYWGRLAENLNAPYAALFTIPVALVGTCLLVRALEARSAFGLFLAGLVAGSAILFKQSLGGLLAYGMVLSILVAACRDGGTRSPLAVLLWAAAGAAVLVPFASYLTPTDYALHFLPLHALMVATGVAAWRSGVPPLRDLVARVAPFAAGAALPLSLVAGLYLFWGGLDSLLYDMFRLPLGLRRYYLPVQLPPASLAVSLLGVVLVVSAGLRALGDSPRVAPWIGLAGVAVMAVGRFGIATDLPRLYEPGVLLSRGPFALEGVLAPFALLSTVLLCRRRLLAADQPALVPVLFLGAMLSFEVFPRAGHTLWILHGALAPVLAAALAAWLTWAGAQRRVAAGLLALLLPVWLVAPVVRGLVSPLESGSVRRALALERTRGLALSERRIEEKHLADIEELVAWLRLATPRDAPVLVLTNEVMIALLSGRRSVLDDRAYEVFLAGWGMLPGRTWDPETRETLLARLRGEPGLIVVERSDPTSANLLRALPGLRELLRERFEPVARFGVYRVLRPRASVPSSRRGDAPRLQLSGPLLGATSVSSTAS